MDMEKYNRLPDRLRARTESLLERIAKDDHFTPSEMEFLDERPAVPGSRDGIDIIPFVVARLDRGVQLSQEQSAVLCTILASNTWHLTGGPGVSESQREEILDRASEAVSILESRFGIDFGKTVNFKLLNNSYDDGMPIVFREPSFSSRKPSDSFDGKATIPERDEFLRWLGKYVSPETMRPLAVRMVSESSDVIRKKIFTLPSGGKYSKSYNRGLYGRFTEWAGFVEEGLRSGVLELFRPGDEYSHSLFLSLLPRLAEGVGEAVENGSFNPDDPRWNGDGLRFGGGKKSPSAGEAFLMKTLMLWSHWSGDEYGLFRLCGDLGLYLERNSIGRTSGGSGKDLYGVFRELKKKKDILLQMKSEWNSLSGTMERLWGRSGEFLPSRGENWDDASTALYGELEQFILRVLGVGQEKELEALLKEFPFLREKDFLFGDELGNTAVPRSVTGGVPLGVKILAAGHSFPDGFLTGSEGGAMPPYEMYFRIFTSSGTDAITAGDLMRDIERLPGDSGICRDIFQYLDWWYDLSQRMKTGVSASVINAGGEVSWSPAGIWEWSRGGKGSEHIRTAGDLLLFTALSKARETENGEDAVKILERTDLWADGYRRMLGLPAVFGGNAPVRMEAMDGMGMFSCLSGCAIRKSVTLGKHLASVMIRLAMTRDEYEEVLLEDERERALEAASWSPASKGGPWDCGAFHTKISKALCLLHTSVKPASGPDVSEVPVPGNIRDIRDGVYSCYGDGLTLGWKKGVTGPSFEKSASAVQQCSETDWDIRQTPNGSAWWGKRVESLLGSDVINVPSSDPDSICLNTLEHIAGRGEWTAVPDFWNRLKEFLSAPFGPEGKLTPAGAFALYRVANKAYQDSPSGVPDSVLETPLDFGMAYRTETDACFLNKREDAPLSVISAVRRKRFEERADSKSLRYNISYLCNEELPLWFFLEVSGLAPVTFSQAVMKADAVVRAVMEGTVSTRNVVLDDRFRQGIPLPKNPVWMDLYAERVLHREREKTPSDGGFISYPYPEYAPLFAGEELVRFLADRGMDDTYVTKDGGNAACEDARRWGSALAVRVFEYRENSCYLKAALEGLREISLLIDHCRTASPESEDDKKLLSSLAAVSGSFALGWMEMTEQGFSETRRLAYGANEESGRIFTQLVKDAENVLTDIISGSHLVEEGLNDEGESPLRDVGFGDIL